MSAKHFLKAAVSRLSHVCRETLFDPERDIEPGWFGVPTNSPVAAGDGTFTAADLIELAAEHMTIQAVFNVKLSPLRDALNAVQGTLASVEFAADADWLRKTWRDLRAAPVFRWSVQRQTVQEPFSRHAGHQHPVLAGCFWATGGFCVVPAKELDALELATYFPAAEPPAVERLRLMLRRWAEEARTWRFLELAHAGHRVELLAGKAHSLLTETGFTDLAAECDGEIWPTVEWFEDFLRKCQQTIDGAESKPGAADALPISEPPRTATMNAENDLATIAALLGSDTAAAMYAIARDASKTVDQQQRAICALDNRVVGWEGNQWAELLRVTDKAARKTDWWKIDRKRLSRE